jgi:hypothetical protein
MWQAFSLLCETFLGNFMTIGDAGSDAFYTGETGDSVFSMQYYRNKATEFQQTLNKVDAAAQSAQRIIDLTYDDYDFQSSDGSLAAELAQKLQEFDAKKALLKGTAEAINFGAASINYVGGRFPQLSIPQTLGLGPLAVPAATIAAIAAAAALIAWGVAWVGDVTSIVQRYITLGSIADPAVKDRVSAELAVLDATSRNVTDSPLASLAGGLKWIVIGGALFLAYQIYMKRDK